MGVLDFIENGAVVPNPNYKKGSKDPLTASPTLISNNPDDYITPTDLTVNRLAKESYGLTDFYNKNYEYYDVAIGINRSEEELNKERAKNQSGVEQFGNALAQILENEVLLGTALGVSNIVDFVANWFIKEPNDYTNQVSSFFEDLQNKNRERLEIYQQNPDKSWQVGDFGWWTNNLVSVGSTVSLMLPSLGVAKGINWISKIPKVARAELKLARNLANIGNRVNKGKTLLFKPERFITEANSWIESATAAAASRIGEGYMEARDTYNTVYEKALEELSQMNDIEKQDLILRNPEFEGKSNEDIAKILAEISGANTFNEDLPLFFLDLLQYKSINNLFKNKLKNTNPNALARLEHKNSMRKLSGIQEEEITTLARVKESLNYAIKHPKELIKSVEFTEGLEEGYQGIVQSRSEELYRMAMDPKVTPKAITSYLADGHIWEQAFWGIVGGTVFKGFSNLIKDVHDEIDRVKNNQRLSKHNTKERITNEKIKSSEINSRFSKMDKFAKKMEALNNGHHYEELELDENGKPVSINGVNQFRALDENEVLQEKEKITNDFITELVMSSIDAGTYNLTKEFIESEYFDKYFKDANVNEADVNLYIKDRIQNRLESTKDTYLKNLDILTTLIDNPYYHSLQLAARDLTRKQINIKHYDDIINNLDNKLLDIKENNRLIDGSYDRELINVINYNLNTLNKHENTLRDDYSKKIISKAALDDGLKNLSKLRNQLYSTLDSIKLQNEQTNAIKEKLKSIKNNKDLNQANAEYNNVLNELSNILFTDNIEVLTNTTRDILNQRAVNDIRKQLESATLPVGDDEIVDLYKDLDYSLTQFMFDKFDKAFKNVEDYIMKSDDPNVAFDEIMTSSDNLSDKLKQSLDVLKLSARTNDVYYKGILEVRDNALKKKKKEAVEAEKVQVNGDEINDESKDFVKEQATKLVEKAQESDNSSTGGQEEDNLAREFIDQAGEAYLKELRQNPRVEREADDYYEDEPYGFNEFSSYLRNHKNYKQYLEIIKNIKQISFEDANYKRIFDTLLDELVRDYGLDEIIAISIIKEQLSGILGTIASARNTNPTLKQKYAILANQLRYGVRIEADGEKLSMVPIAESNEEQYKILDEIIKLFKEETKDNSDVLNVDKFFEYIMQNEEISFNTASVIFNYFTDYLLDREINTNNSYVFDNFRDNATDFFNNLRQIKSQEDIISDYMHISASTKQNDKYKKALALAKEGHPVYVKENPSHTKQIQIMCNGVELGYITKVEALNNKNTKYKKAANASGINWIVEKTDDGYKSNYDEFFKILSDSSNKDSQELINSIELFLAKNKVSDDDLDHLHDLFYNFANGNGAELWEEFERQRKNAKNKKDIYIIKNLTEILNIIQFNKNIPFEESYQSWLEKVYTNFEQTKQIQDTLQNNPDATINVDLRNIGVRTPNYVDEPVDVASQPFIEEKNVVFAVDRTGKVLTEKGNHKFNDATVFTTGTMGFLLSNVNGNPIVGRFVEANGVTKNSELYKALYKYLTDIFTKYQTNENYTINNLYEDLLEVLVLRKDKNDNTFNPLFTGYTLVKINGGIAVAKAGKYREKDAKTPFVLAIYDKKYTKKGYDGEAGQTRSYTLFNEEGKPFVNEIDGERVSYATHNPLYIHGMVEDIISGLRFNRSMTFINNRNEPNVKTNKHFYKENGKLYVEFGDSKIEYNSYFNFIMRNNAFKVNVESKNNSFTRNTAKSNDIYISVSKIRLGKSDFELLQPESNIEEAIQLIESATEDTPVSTVRLLNLVGYNNDVFTQWAEKGIFSQAIYYHKNDTNGEAGTENEKIYLKKNAIPLIRKRPYELIRLIAHEDLHNQIENASVFERKDLINQLLDTYNQFVKAVEERANNGDRDAIAIKNWIEKYNFKPDNKFVKNDVDNRTFAEEWLVESMTNGPITKMLNEITYEGEVRTTEKKSIFQKILELVLNLFGIKFDNINKNSILAKQISLFSDDVLYEPANIQRNENNDITISSPVEEEQVMVQEQPVVEEQSEPQGETYDFIEDESDELLSSTIFDYNIDDSNYIEKSIDDFEDNSNNNPNGYVKTNDMEKFIRQYPPHIQPKIRILVNTGAIKFICR